MKMAILGCGNVGSRLATMFLKEKHEVYLMDLEPEAFKKLGKQFEGRTFVYHSIDKEILSKMGVEKLDVFLAVTNKDNTNIMAAQVANRLGIPRVIARVEDPVRAQAYKDELGLETYCPTLVTANAIRDMVVKKKK
jgi:trk system potassium uptake protein TrkA